MNWNKNYRPDSVPSDSACVVRKGKFNPTREEVSRYVKEYLDNGGCITLVKPTIDSETDFNMFKPRYIPECL